MTTPQKIGRYEILEELGRGAMGAVYRAKDPAMDRIVALKTIIATALASEQGSEFRERFFREARAAGNLTHPGIVPVFDVGEHDGVPFIIMEYVSGWTLASAGARGERLDLNRICEIGQKIAEALGYAHQRGVVHRDIKPANILITSRETYGVERPKITDFGIAKLTESEATMTGKMLGTPAFMPPEQFTGAPVDGRADIFSLGVVLYWLSTGEQPFPGEGLTAVLYKVVHTEPIPPRKLNPSLPPRFESIVLKCMEKDPAARYQSAEDLARELGDLRSNKSATAPPAAKTFTPIRDTDATLVEPVPFARPAVEAPDTAARDTAATVLQQTPAPVTAHPVAAPAPTAPSPAPAKKTKKNSSLIGMVSVGVPALVVAAGFAIHLRHKQVSAPAPAPLVSVAPPPTNSSPVGKTDTPPVPPPLAAATPTPTATPTAQKQPATLIKESAAPTADRPVPATAPVTAPASSGKPSAAAPVASGKFATLKNTAANFAKFIAPKKDSSAISPAPVSTPAASALGFDPSKLDPKQNARLTLDSSDMPAGLQFTVEMNGRVYSRNVQGANADLYVPPGMQQFSVTATDKSVTKSSNTASADFKAKKHYTLHVELHLQGQPASAGMPNGLYNESQIVIVLK